MIRRLIVAFVVAGVFALGVVVGTRLEPQNVPAPGAAAYMEGLQHLDGQAVWDARSAAAKDQDARDLFYREHSASVAMGEQDKAAYLEKARQDEISFFDAMRAKGASFGEVRYYGGHANGGSGIYVYETTKHLPDGDVEYVWAVMTDAQGKVVQVQ